MPGRNQCANRKKDFYKFIEISIEILTGSLGLVPYVVPTRCPYEEASACVFAFCCDLSLRFAVSLFCSAPGGAVHIRRDDRRREGSGPRCGPRSPGDIDKRG